MHASDPPRSLRLRRSFWKTVSIYPRSAPVRHIRLRSFAVLCGECLYFMNFWAVDLLQIRYAAILAWFCPRFCSWFWPILYFFSLRDINLTLGLLSPRRHVVWRDAVGVESSRSGLKIRMRGYFSSEWLSRHTDEPPKGRNSCLGYNPALFWVLSVSCWCLGELISRSTISIAVFCLQNLIRLHQFSAYTLIPKGWYSPIKVTGVLVGKFREHP